MDNEVEETLLWRLGVLEEFVAGMSRRLIDARGEAMAATFCLAEVINILGGERTGAKFSIGEALVCADAALDHERAAAEPKTLAAIDHARLLLKNMEMNRRDTSARRNRAQLSRA